MRVKAVPSAVINTVKANPLIFIGGIVVIGAGLYFYSMPAPEVDQTANDSSGYGYAAPIAYNLPTYDVGSSGGTSNSGGGNSNVAVDPNAVTTRELFEFEKLKANQDYELNLLSIKQQSDITAANLALGYQSLMASSFSASTSLASSMLRSGATSLMGAFFGPNGEQWSFGLAQTIATTSKKKKVINATAAANAAGQTALQNFLSSMRGTNNAIPSSPSNPTGTTYSGGTMSLPYQPNGSTAIAAIDNGYSYNSGQQSSYAPQAVTGQETNAGNGQSGMGGNIRNVYDAAQLA